MSTRSERDKQKALQERHQAILAQLLKDEDNKYCVDCDAKGLLTMLIFFPGSGFSIYRDIQQNLVNLIRNK